MDQSRRRVAVVALAMSTALSPITAGGVFAAPPDRLSTATLAAIRATMEPQERAEMDARTADPRIVPVAYSRFRYRIAQTADGTETLTLLERQDASATSGFALTTIASTAPEVVPMAAGTGGYQDLYISISVNRDTRYSGYVWLLGGYFSFSSPSSALSGLFDIYNGTEDKFATGWAGGLALIADGASGVYYRPTSVNPGPLDIRRDGVTANAGVSYSFHEWARTACGPQGLYSCQVQWGQNWQNIQETTWKNTLSNVVITYYHTSGSSLNPGIGVSVSGPSVWLTASPSSAVVWSAAAYTSFTN